jgi:cardiolipin synthase
MMHAKTAVVDGRWARVGSTNLNITSWLGNWELDVVIEDRRFAGEMEKMYLDDLSHSTEIVLGKRPRRPVAAVIGKAGTRERRAAGMSRTAAGVVRLGKTVGAAMTNRRELGPAEATIMFWGAALLAGVSGIALIWPRVVVFPLVALGLWTAASLLVRIYRLRVRRRKR